MIVKSLGRRGIFAAAKSLTYVSNPEKVMRNPDGSPVIFTHNVFGRSLSEVEREFQENEEKRLHRRANNNIILHSILAFSPADREKLSAEKLEKLTREYFRLSNPDALFYATVHEDKENFHVHIVASGCDMLGAANRMDRERFQQLKKDLQEFQQNIYPELEASVVEHVAEEKEFSKPTYWQKDGRISEKERLRNALFPSFDLANSRAEFFELLRQDNLQIYERGGVEAGISGERNFRFRTLGFDLSELDLRRERLAELEERDIEVEPDLMRASSEDPPEMPIESERIELPSEEALPSTDEPELTEEEKRLEELENLFDR